MNTTQIEAASPYKESKSVNPLTDQEMRRKQCLRKPEKLCQIALILIKCLVIMQQVSADGI